MGDIKDFATKLWLASLEPTTDKKDSIDCIVNLLNERYKDNKELLLKTVSLLERVENLLATGMTSCSGDNCDFKDRALQNSISELIYEIKGKV